jgi:hypothetical protein
MNSVTDIARVCHEANRALQLIQADPAPSPSWDDAPQWQRDSAIDGVRFALDGKSPREQHIAWCADKYRDGWVYGEVKDADAKTHHCLVDYDELPEGQRDKDRVFVAIVDALSGRTS